MTVATSISKALRKYGRPMLLRRAKTGGGWEDVTVYGTTDGATISKIVGILVESGTVAVFSNAEIAAKPWPGPPKAEDRMIVDGKAKKIQGDPETKFLGPTHLVHVCKIIGI